MMNTTKPSIKLPLLFASSDCYQRKNSNLFPSSQSIVLDEVNPNPLAFLDKFYLLKDKAITDWEPEPKNVRRKLAFLNTKYCSDKGICKIRLRNNSVRNALTKLQDNINRNSCVISLRFGNKAVNESSDKAENLALTFNFGNKLEKEIVQGKKTFIRGLSKPKIVSVRWIKENLNLNM